MISERVGHCDYEGKDWMYPSFVRKLQPDATMNPHHSDAAKTDTLLTG